MTCPTVCPSDSCSKFKLLWCYRKEPAYQSLVKLPFQTKDTRLTLSTNLWQVYQGARRDEDVALVQTPSHGCIDKTTQVWDDWQTWCREVIW